MGKYNVNINMSNKNCSHTLILEQIKPCSMVLEMGCATGYMTRYMKEKLGCTVDIVEVDKQSFDTAMPYARSGCLGDIDCKGWSDIFKPCKSLYGGYDYILFADVLEHLKDPKKALCLASELLRDDGKILISIPNVCHNDIILQMYHNHFRYTNIGLLDNTHLRFWGIEDFADFVNDIGLKITDTKTVVLPTQRTEQRLPFKVDGVLKALLDKREYGEVYQWIFTCEKR